MRPASGCRLGGIFDSFPLRCAFLSGIPLSRLRATPMPLSFQNSAVSPDTKTPTLFLPGWGFDGRILQLLAPTPKWLYPLTPLDPATIDQDLLHLLDSRQMEKVRLIGWSMGAMLGLDFAARHSNRIASLVLVALRPHWPHREIKDIRHEFNRKPEIFLRGFYRKCFLGDKQAYRNFASTLEPLYLTALGPNREMLLRGLEYLENFEIPRSLPEVPVRLVHGRQDLDGTNRGNIVSAGS